MKKYVFGFLSLAALTFLTTGIAMKNMGGLNLPIALFISATEAAVIILFFTDIRQAVTLIKLFAFGGLFWLFIMIILTLSDYTSRNWLPSPSVWEESSQHRVLYKKAHV